MKFEAIDKKLREVGLKFTNPTIERRKDKWHFELRIDSDYKSCVNGFIHYLYKEENHNYNSIGNFIASGSNLNKLVTVLFERIKSKEVIYRHGNIIDGEVVWGESIVTWDEVNKKFIKTFIKNLKR
jgi:hypothetical protein